MALSPRMVTDWLFAAPPAKGQKATPPVALFPDISIGDAPISVAKR